MQRKTRTDLGRNVQIQYASLLSKEGVSEHHVLISVCDPRLPWNEQIQAIDEAYREFLRTEPEARPVFQRFFLSDGANQIEALQDLVKHLPRAATSIVQQAPLNGTKIALWAYLQTKVELCTSTEGSLVATHGAYRHLWTGGLHAAGPNSDEQTRGLLKQYKRTLEEESCTWHEHCVRTWFFLSEIDVNYAGMVRARRELFAEYNLTENTHYITSTGIEGRHADPSTFVHMDAYSISGLQAAQVQYLDAPTHLNPTYEYGVTFERGVAIQYGDRKHVFLSGTASIDNQGAIVHPGHILPQLERSLENVSVLLQEAGACLEDVMQAIVYLRDPADAQVVRDYLQNQHPTRPYLLVQGAVCRPGWLIEIECIAVCESRHLAFAPL